MTDYKSPPSRLARFFKDSRNGWKQKALERQNKLRAADVKVRDLTKSRDKWKREAKETKQRLEQLEKEVEQIRAENKKSEYACLSKQDAEVISATPAGHQYTSHIMLMGIRQVTYGLSSLRGSERIFELFSQFSNLPVPSFNSVRSWMFRLGLYLTRQAQEWREDWIFILDHTMKLGQRKCLLILGVTKEQLQTKGYALQHQDVTVLGMDVVTTSTGETVKEQLKQVSEKVGTPLQILSDHGSDIKKGVESYQLENSTVIYTYDITHKMAALLKAELHTDEKWNDFLKQCGQARTSLKQTNLHFLLPPRQRTKARYSNIAPRIEWGEKIIAYQQRGEYEQIDPAFTLDQQTIKAVEEAFGSASAHPLSMAVAAEESKTYVNQDAFTESLLTLIGDEQVEQMKSVIYPAAAQGQRQFEQKLGWVVDYRDALEIYAQMNQLVTMAEEEVKHHGLDQHSYTLFENSVADRVLSPQAASLAKKISQYVKAEGEQIPNGQILLGTSDIIESIFGKYKYLSSECPVRDMGKMILTMPVLTTELTRELVKTAMESVQALDVEKWADKLLGKSSLSKQRVLSNALNTT